MESRKSWFPLTASSSVPNMALSQQHSNSLFLPPASSVSHISEDWDDSFLTATPTRLALPRFLIKNEGPSKESQPEHEETSPSQSFLVSPQIEATDTLVLKYFERKAIVEFDEMKANGCSQTKCVLLKNPLLHEQKISIFSLPPNIETPETMFTVSAEGEYLLHLVWTPTRAGCAMRELLLLFGDCINHLQIVLLGRTSPAPLPVRKKLVHVNPGVRHVLKPVNPTVLSPVVETSLRQVSEEKPAVSNEPLVTSPVFALPRALPPRSGTKKPRSDSPPANRQSQFASSPSSHRRVPPPSMSAKFDSHSDCEFESPQRAVTRISQLHRRQSQSQSNLRAVSPLIGQPRHRVPYFSTNMYHDNQWQEKQERGFHKWLNHIFVDSAPSHEAAGTEVDPEAITENVANSGDSSSLRNYANWRVMNALRKRACQLYQREDFAGVVRRVEEEVDKGKFQLRSDLQFRVDKGAQASVRKVLHGYCPAWLHIGLEMVYNEIIPSPTGTASSATLARFLQQRLFYNEDLEARYVSSCPQLAPSQYRSPEYNRAFNCFVLKKLLCVVFFLDRAKTAKLVDGDPCLFRVTAPFKKSRDILLYFSREFLHRQGDITRHLGYLGYRVSHEQTHLEEFDMRITNLAMDLRDGVRLCKLAEVTLGMENGSVMRQLLCPAVSRVQKIHNVTAAMRTWEERGTHLLTYTGTKIDPRDIVDGHREPTLALLSCVLFKHHFVTSLLRVEALAREIVRARRCWRSLKGEALSVSGTVRYPLSSLPEVLTPTERKQLSTWQTEDECASKVSLLFEWCRAVAALYGLQVENFGSSFSDGRVLCVLVSHYLPSLLPLHLVQWNTSSCSSANSLNLLANVSACEEDELLLSNTSAFISDRASQQELLQNERCNFQLLKSKIVDLGGVPLMLSAENMVATLPDHKLVMSFLGFLSARLLDMSEERAAAIVLQRVWKRRRQQRELLVLDEEENEVSMPLNALQTKVLEGEAEVSIPSPEAPQLDALHTKAAICIQAIWRAHVARRHFIKLRQAALALQRHWRHRRQTRLIHQERSQSAVVIQAAIRSFLARREACRRRQAVVRIQRWWRQVALKRVSQLSHVFRERAQHQEECEAAARKVQVWFRRSRSRRQAIRRTAAATSIASWWRGVVQRRRFVQLKRTVLLIQRAWRHRHNHRRSSAAMTIQRYWRGHVARVRLVRQLLNDTECQYVAHIRVVLMEIRRNPLQEPTLAHRAEEAMRNLFHPQVSGLIDALTELDDCTRLSRELCLSISMTEALSKLLELLERCNRSEPHKDIQFLIISVLYNLARYPPSRQSLLLKSDTPTTACGSPASRLPVLLIRLILYAANDKMGTKGFALFERCSSLLALLCESEASARCLLAEKGLMLSKLREVRQRMQRQWSARHKLSLSSGTTCLDKIAEEEIVLLLGLNPYWNLRKRAVHTHASGPSPFLATFVQPLDKNWLSLEYLFVRLMRLRLVS